MGRFTDRMRYDPVTLEIPINLARDYARVERIVDDAINDFIGEDYSRSDFGIQINYNVKRVSGHSRGSEEGVTLGYTGEATVVLAYIRD